MRDLSHRKDDIWEDDIVHMDFNDGTEDGCAPGTWPRARAVVWCVIGAGNVVFWVLLASWLGWLS